MLRVSNSGAAGGGREGRSYDFLTPPIKTGTPNGKPQKHPPPLKSKAPFHEMILEKNPNKSKTVINTCDCFTHEKHWKKMTDIPEKT